MIHNYILNNKVTKEALDEEKENNNESYMNYKTEDKNTSTVLLLTKKSESVHVEQPKIPKKRENSPKES